MGCVLNYQPSYPEEFIRKLIWIVVPDSNWCIGLPFSADPHEVTPPCFIHFAPKKVVTVNNGNIELASMALSIDKVLSFLESAQLDILSQLAEVTRVQAAYTIANAIRYVQYLKLHYSSGSSQVIANL